MKSELMFSVALIGPDGAGKTTIARRLEQILPIPAKYLYLGVSVESLNLPLPTTWLMRLVRRKRRSPAVESSPRGRERFGASLGLANRLAEESYRRLLAAFYRRRGRIVICDRHYRLDFAPELLQTHGSTPSLIARLHQRVVEKLYGFPELVIYLDAPADVLLARKGGHTLPWLGERRQAFVRLGQRVPNFVRVDATQPLEDVLAEVSKCILDFYQARTRNCDAVQPAGMPVSNRDAVLLDPMSTATARPEITPQFGSAQIDCVRRNAALYYPELSGSALQLRYVSRMERPSSTILRCEVRSAGARRWIRIKLPPARRTAAPFAHPASPAERLRLEYYALTALQSHFQLLNDERFGAIRVFEFLPENSALVMEELHEPTLRRLLLATVRISPKGDRERLYRALRHAGAWLRAFHALPVDEHAERRHADLSVVVAQVEEYTGYLAKKLGRPAFFLRFAREFEREAGKHPSGPLPLVVRHGDFAPRNLFVGSGERITSCDTAANSVAPCYDDLVYFLTELRIGQAQVLTRGLALATDHLARCESEFLAGYFDAVPVPCDMLRLFRANRLLKKWAMRVFRSVQSPSLWHGTVPLVRFLGEDWFFRRTLLSIWPGNAYEWQTRSMEA